MTGGGAPLLRLRGGTVVRGGVRVLGPIDLACQPGTILGLFGPEGSGKTTLLKLLAGLLPLATGELTFQPAGLKRGMLFQREGLLDAETLEANVALPLRALTVTERTRRVASALAEVDLSAHAHKLPAQLSGGMKKRAGIARVVASQAALKLYDDPTAGLDPVTALGILQLIARAHDPAGLTVLAASEPLGMASLCTLTLRLERGQQASTGAAA